MTALLRLLQLNVDVHDDVKDYLLHVGAINLFIHLMK